MKKIALIIILLSNSLCLFAGDVATYINLGFSKDANVFMFGQYGISEDTMKTYADIYAVDVKKNVFVKNGIMEKVFPDKIFTGQDGIGGLLMLLHDSTDLIDRYKINHVATGRVVYILIDGDTPKERLEFRDFNKGNRYVLTLVQEKFGSKDTLSSSFHINVAITDKKDNTETFTVGLPNYKRKGVAGYRVKQVVFNPDETALVIVVEKDLFSVKAGKSIRYMVETLPLN